MTRAPIVSLLRLLVAVCALAATPSALACGNGGYTYAGLASATRAHGVAATVTAIGAPGVSSGHVAAWVGVGGPGLGPRRTDEWIQVGLNGFAGSPMSNLYYEVTRPGLAPTYHQLESGLSWGTARRLAVLEIGSRPNWWQVWVNGRPAGDPVFLPGSHGAWRGIATTESWGAGGSQCNRFAYRFDGIRVARKPGGSWRRLASALPILSRGFRFVRPSASSFVAVSGQVLKPVDRPVLSATQKPPATVAAVAALLQPAPLPAAPPAAFPPADDPALPVDPLPSVDPV